MNSNDNVPEDELILAELIATASEHGLVGCRGFFFTDKEQVGDLCSDLDSSRPLVGLLDSPPPGATSCRASGALLLSKNLDREFNFSLGNDAGVNDVPSDIWGEIDSVTEDELMTWNIGAAFNQAMDPSYEERVDLPMEAACEE